eukprot:403373047
MSQKNNSSSSTSCISFLRCCQKQPSQYQEKNSTNSNEVHPDRNQVMLRQTRQQNARSQEGAPQARLIQRQQNQDGRINANNQQQFERANSQVNVNQNSQNLRLSTSHHNQSALMQSQQNVQPQKLPKISNIAMDTNFKLEDIECCDFLPQDRQLRHEFKYYCPVCLRYFKNILISSCCINYLCHFCAVEQIEREQSVETYFAKCPYSCDGKFILKDVSPNMQVKRYSDSQCMSFYSNNLGGRKQSNTLNGFNKTVNKENMTPKGKGGMYLGTGENFNQINRMAVFQNSANGFMNQPYQNGTDELILEEDEESKRQAMMHRSDAMQYAQRPPLNQLRANIIRQANQGLINNNSIQNGGDDIYSYSPNIYDPDNQQYINPQMMQTFPQNIDQLSAIENNFEGGNTIGSSAGFRNFHEGIIGPNDNQIIAQEYQVQDNQFINVQNFSPQQHRDGLSSIEEDEDDLARENHQ